MTDRMTHTSPEVQRLTRERQTVLNTTTTTQDEYRAKRVRVNELTLQIALAKGATRAEMATYGQKGTTR